MATLERPAWIQQLLERVPEGFADDGCSRGPDRVFRFDLRHACRLHDWRGCTRCHGPGDLTLDRMIEANLELERIIADALPWRWRWLKWPYYWAVKRFNGDVAWDSCGPNPRGASAGQIAQGLCRHSMPEPEWMRGPRAS
jgi:hypothetical protein